MNGFTVTRVYFSNDGSKPYFIGSSRHFIYNSYTGLYECKSHDGDIITLSHIPRNGSRGLSLKLGYHTRHIITID